MKLSGTSQNDNTIAAVVPPTPASFKMLGDGNTVSATLGATEVEWSLEGSRQALADLGACMDKNIKR